MDAFFHGRVYAISGGASGIGLATAKALLRGGAKVSIGDVRVPDDLREELRTNTTTDKGLDDFVLLKTVDVRSRADVEGWIEETVGKFGQLDGAANLAGTIPKDHNVGTIETVRDEDWEFVMGVNVYGVMNCLRAEIKHMTGGGGGGGHGSIVNAGSGLSLEGRAGTSAYTASKHAVLGLTRCVAKEVGKRGVRVNCIAPGFTSTPLMQQSMSIEGSSEDFSGTALGRMAQPSEIADTILYLLSDKASFITGAVIAADGGWHC